jgi:hypothetical protein
MAVIIKNGVFWDVTPCGVRRLLVVACVVLSSQILVTLMKEAPVSSETSVFIRATRRNIPENTNLHSLKIILNCLCVFCRENFTLSDCSP